MPTFTYIDVRSGDVERREDLDTEAPSTPTNLMAVAVSDTEIELTWTASTDNVGVDIYSVYRGLSGETFIADVPASPTSYTVTGLTPNTSYTFEIDATDVAGNVSDRYDQATETTDA